MTGITWEGEELEEEKKGRGREGRRERRGGEGRGKSSNDQINYSPPNICSALIWKEKQLFNVGQHLKLKKFNLNVQGRSVFSRWEIAAF